MKPRVVQSGDTCSNLATNYCQSDLTTFVQANNPVLSGTPGCGPNLPTGITLCCANGNHVTSCLRSTKIKSGDTCWSIANSLLIQLSDLYFMNQGLNAFTCNNLVPGNYLCTADPWRPACPPYYEPQVGACNPALFFWLKKRLREIGSWKKKYMFVGNSIG